MTGININHGAIDLVGKTDWLTPKHLVDYKFNINHIQQKYLCLLLMFYFYFLLPNYIRYHFKWPS